MRLRRDRAWAQGQLRLQLGGRPASGLAAGAMLEAKKRKGAQMDKQKSVKSNSVSFSSNARLVTASETSTTNTTSRSFEET